MKSFKLIALITIGFLPNLIFAQAPKNTNTIIVEGTKEKLMEVLIDRFFIVHNNGNQVYTELKYKDVTSGGYSIQIIIKIDGDKMILKGGGTYTDISGVYPFSIVRRGMKGSIFYESFKELETVALGVNKEVSYETN